MIRLSHNPELGAVFHRAMSAFTLRSVEALVERPEFTSVRHLLDVGGGDGTTSLWLAARYPQLRLTVFDMPSVSALAPANAVPDAGDRVRGHRGHFRHSGHQELTTITVPPLGVAAHGPT